MFLFKWLLYIIFGFFIIVFALSNHQIIDLKLWPFDLEISMALFLLIFVVFFLGITFASLVYYFSNFKLRHTIRKQRKLITTLESQVGSSELSETINKYNISHES